MVKRLKNGVRLVSHEDYMKEILKDPEFRKEYEKFDLEFYITDILIGLRMKLKQTQKEFAKKLGTTQSAISRLENGEISPTIRFLGKVAKTFGKKLVIEFK